MTPSSLRSLALVINASPSAGLDLDPLSQTMYVFDAESLHRNQVLIHIANPLPTDIVFQGHEVIEVMVSTTAPGAPNPNGLTTPDNIAAITINQVVQDAKGVWKPVDLPQWTMQPVKQEGDQYVFRLMPSSTHPPSIVIKGNGVLSIALDQVKTTLAGRVAVVRAGVQGFQGLAPLTENAWSMTIKNYPEPLGNLNALGVQTAGTPLKVSWNTQYVDTLMVRFTDITGGVVSYTMTKDQLPANATDFEVLPCLALAGWIEMVGTNDSNKTHLYAQQRVDVSGTMTITGKLKVVSSGCPTTGPVPARVSSSGNNIILSWPDFAPVETWTVDPPGLMKLATPQWAYLKEPGSLTWFMWNGTPYGFPFGGLTADYKDTVQLSFTTPQIAPLSIDLGWNTFLSIMSDDQQGIATHLTVSWDGHTSSKLNANADLPWTWQDSAPVPSPDKASVDVNVAGTIGNDSYALHLNTDSVGSQGMYTVTIKRPYHLDAGVPPLAPLSAMP